MYRLLLFVVLSLRYFYYHHYHIRSFVRSLRSLQLLTVLCITALLRPLSLPYLQQQLAATYRVICTREEEIADDDDELSAFASSSAQPPSLSICPEFQLFQRHNYSKQSKSNTFQFMQVVNSLSRHTQTEHIEILLLLLLRERTKGGKKKMCM